MSRVPRLSRLTALAIKYDEMIRQGCIENISDLARLGRITRARAMQIMNLLILAPDIQEDILFLPTTTKGFDPGTEHDLRDVIKLIFWNRQRVAWGERRRVKIDRS
jgi:hypothetical protein